MPTESEPLDLDDLTAKVMERAMETISKAEEELSAGLVDEEDRDGVIFAVSGGLIIAAVNHLIEGGRGGHAVMVMTGLLEQMIGGGSDKPYKQEKQRQKAARKAQRRHR